MKNIMLISFASLLLLTGIYFVRGREKADCIQGEFVLCDTHIIEMNTSDAFDFRLLDGLGEKTAASIIEYRDKNGGFDSKSEIKEIYGIAEKKFAKWEKLLTLNN